VNWWLGVMEPIHIFLDTTLTYEDPFFKKNFNRQLLRIAEIYEIPIFISRIVYEETRNNFITHVKEKIEGLENSLFNLKMFYPSTLDIDSINCSLKDFLNGFDKFYNDLFTRSILKLIDYDNDILPVLVERSIKKIKPFGNKKQEFRDAITWLSYARYAEMNELENCFFVTANISDFCDNMTKNTIHPDLLKDSNRFSHFVSAGDLLKNEKVAPYLTSADITEWLYGNAIDRQFILEVVYSDFFKEKLFSRINNMDLEKLISHSLPRSIGICISTEDIADLDDDIETTIVKDQLVVKGDVYLDVFVYLGFYDEFDQEISISGNEQTQVCVTYSFTMDANKIYYDTLEFNNIDVTMSADFRYLFDDYER
jgi:hypothetical protein